MTRIKLPWPAPPLRSNARLKWQPKARLVKQIREAARYIAKGHAPITGPVIVRLIWTVPDNRRRDAGASSPTLKAALDGFVDAGLLPGDHHTVVTEERCGIQVVKGVSEVWIEIEGVG